METKGFQVFSRNENVPSADILCRVLTAAHKVVKQNDALRPTRPTDRTWLIHPSPVSEAALDFIFETEKGVFSPYSSALFKHLNRLRNAFTLYVLTDLLFSLEKIYPALFPAWISEIDTSLLTNVVDASARKLIAIIDEVNFIARIERLADKFDQAVRMYFCLGVVPTSRGGNCDMVFTPVKGDVFSYVETYISFLETTVDTFSVITTDVLLRNTVLTVRNGTYGCTDYAGVPYVLWSFGRVPTYFKAGFISRPPLINMMQYEFQYMFANARHRHQALEKMTKTSVVVSSTLTAEAEAILDTTRQRSSLSNPSEMIQSIEKEREKLNVLEIKANIIKMAANTSSNNNTNESTLNYKQQLAALEAAVDINSTLEKSLHRHFNRTKSNKNLDSYNSEDQYIPSIVQEHGMIHGAGPERRRKEIKETNKIVQEKLLEQKIRKLHSEVAEYHKETDVLRQELMSMIRNQAKLDFQIKMKQTSIELTEQKLAEMTKERDKVTKTLKKYEELIENMKETVENALCETNAGETERTRLLKMFTHAEFCDASGQCVDTKYEFNQNSKSLIEFLHLILGDNATKESQKNANSKDTERSEYAYEKMLKEHSIYVIPFFTGIQNQATLDACNYWLPHEWMHDKLLEPFSKDGHRIVVDAAGRQAVTNTPELYMLDVNPKTCEETLKIKRAIDAANGTTLFDSVFQRNFLNVQFPVQGSVEESINSHLKEKWHHLIGGLLLLSGETFTKNGQRIGARVSSTTIDFFIAPFLAQYMGRRGYARRIPTLVAAFLDKTTAEIEETGFAPYEQLVYSFCQRQTSFAHSPRINESNTKHQS